MQSLSFAGKPASKPSLLFRSALALAALALGTAGGRPLAAQYCADPYLFILFDTSGSMSLAPPCSAVSFAAGDCSQLCTSPEGCRAPLHSDDPASRLSVVKSALHASLSGAYGADLQLGFATFNQDELSARSKHWVYEATNNGTTIPGWGPFPANGDREVLGKTWACDNGTGDAEVGCSANTPADLPDAWERERVRQLPKAGEALTQTVSVFVRQGTNRYRAQYIPVSGALGSGVDLQVRIDRCLNSSCSSIQAVGATVVTYAPIAEHLVWDSAISRSEPVSYFSQLISADLSATNTCAGWDPNSDSANDAASGYALRWATVSDLRGAAYSAGDVLPLDWLADHRQDILGRLAPNQVTNPLASPDFRTAPYLQDLPLPAEAFLRLADEDERPLLPAGSTPLGNTLQSFRTWWASWSAVAAVNDPDYACRRQAVVLVTDGDETCAGSPCDVADDLYTLDGVEVYVVAFSVDPTPGSVLPCIAANGGTGTPLYPTHHDELVQALETVFDAVKQP